MRAVTAIRRAIQRATPAIALGTAALTATLAACSDAPTGLGGTSSTAATRAPAPPPPAEMLAALSVNSAPSTTGGLLRSEAPLGIVTGAGTSVSQSTRGDTAVMVVTFDPTVAHTITFLTRPGNGKPSANGVVLAASSVCELTSGYGPLLWNAPCTTATKPFTVTIRGWMGVDKRPALSFSPDLRFAPATTNWLWVADGAPPPKASGAVVWCPTVGQACVNEGASDAALTTGYAQGVYYRRIKHFSGYTVIVNRTGELQ